MKRSLYLVLSTLLLFVSTAGTAMAHITDAANNPYHTAIEYVSDHKIMNGYEDHTFRPLGKVNRAELVKILVSAKYSPDDLQNCTKDTSPAYLKLTDVHATDWYAPALCVAYKNSFMKGYPDSTFRAGEYVTIAEAGKMMVQILGYGVKEDPVEWYRPYLEKLEKLRALPKTLTYVTGTLTRADVAEMLYVILDGQTGEYSISINRLIINQRLHDAGKM